MRVVPDPVFVFKATSSKDTSSVIFIFSSCSIEFSTHSLSVTYPVCIRRDDCNEKSLEIFMNYMNYFHLFDRGLAWATYSEHRHYIRQDAACASAAFTKNTIMWHLPAALCGGVGVLTEVKQKIMFYCSYLFPWSLLSLSLSLTTNHCGSLSLSCWAEVKGVSFWCFSQFQHILHLKL